MQIKLMHLVVVKDYYMRRDTTTPADAHSIQDLARMRVDPLHEVREWLKNCTLQEYLLLLKVVRKLQVRSRVNLSMKIREHVY
jgi:hypothetical protein